MPCFGSWFVVSGFMAFLSDHRSGRGGVQRPQGEKRGKGKHLSRRRCGLTLKDSGKGGQIGYASVSRDPAARTARPAEKNI